MWRQLLRRLPAGGLDFCVAVGRARRSYIFKPLEILGHSLYACTSCAMQDISEQRLLKGSLLRKVLGEVHARYGQADLAASLAAGGVTRGLLGHAFDHAQLLLANSRGGGGGDATRQVSTALRPVAGMLSEMAGWCTCLHV